MRTNNTFVSGIILLTVILILVFIPVVSISAVDANADPDVIRTLPSSASPCDIITVQLDVVVGSASSYAIDEQIPTNWEIVSTSGDTTEQGHVKWLVVSGAEDITYTYSVKIPANASGEVFFNGKYQMSGMDAQADISGDQAIQIYAAGTGVIRTLPDKANSGDIIDVELDVKVGTATYYTVDETVADGWEIISASGGGDYTSETGHVKWIILNDAKDTTYTYRIKIPEVAVGSYTFSGYSTFEGMPESNIGGDEGVLVYATGVKRELPERAAPDSTADVRLYVNVGTATEYVIDEQVPDGWAITNVSGAGDTSDPGHVKWIVTTGAKDTTYTYSVTTPSEAEGIYSFDGEYMMEGMGSTADIYGDRDVSVGAGIVTRMLPSTANAGDEITVSLDVDVDITNAYLIDEEVPTGWTITTTSGDTSEDGHVKWNVTSGAVDTVYTYDVSIPSGASGKHFLNGKYIFENMSEDVAISGDDCIDVRGVGVSRTLPAVALPNSTIEVGLDVEVGLSDSYLIDEKVPDGWAITTTSGDTSEAGHVKWNVTSGAVDTVYAYDVVVPSGCTGTRSFAGEYMLADMTVPNNIIGDESVSVGTGIVTRVLPSSAIAGHSIEVVLDVYVGEADSYLIDEQVPDGWVITNVSGAGDTSDPGHVKWIVTTGAKDTTYTYSVTTPSEAEGIYSFDGEYMMEGMAGTKNIGDDTHLDVVSTIIPIITPAPSGDVTSKKGESVTFSISVNQNVNATWYLNGTYLFTNDSVNAASYTNSSGDEGTWNITVVVSNVNGNSSFTWIWTVERKFSPCYIATATYGTPLDSRIDILRDFRDNVLVTNPIGEAFVSTYYRTSPPIADALRENDGLRTITRSTLVDPLVSLSKFALNGILLVFIIGLTAVLSFRRDRMKILKSLLVGTGSILVSIAVIFSLGFVGSVIPFCAVVGAYLLPLVIPMSVVFTLCTLLKLHVTVRDGAAIKVEEDV